MGMYTKAQFAEKIGVTVRTVTRWEGSGKLKGHILPNGKKYYDDNHINQFKNIENESKISIDIQKYYKEDYGTEKLLGYGKYSDKVKVYGSHIEQGIRDINEESWEKLDTKIYPIIVGITGCQLEIEDIELDNIIIYGTNEENRGIGLQLLNILNTSYEQDIYNYELYSKREENTVINNIVYKNEEIPGAGLRTIEGIIKWNNNERKKVIYINLSKCIRDGNIKDIRIELSKILQYIDRNNNVCGNKVKCLIEVDESILNKIGKDTDGYSILGDIAEGYTKKVKNLGTIGIKIKDSKNLYKDKIKKHIGLKLDNHKIDNTWVEIYKECGLKLKEC